MSKGYFYYENQNKEVNKLLDDILDLRDFANQN